MTVRRTEEELFGLISAHIAKAIGADLSESVEAGRAFRDSGLGSLGIMQLCNLINETTGLSLSAGDLFDYPTPAALAEYVALELAGAPRLVGETILPHTGDSDEPIVIVSMSCRYPGGADSPEQLWRLLMEGRDAVSEFPTDRGWDIDHLYDADPAVSGTTYVTRGGFLHDAAEFDAAFFGISPREALAMDPQQRIILENAWELFERAGIVPETLRESSTGIFLGITNQEYGLVEQQFGQAEGYIATGQSFAVAAGRIAYVLGLRGPAIAVDTACSSSLVALHLACQSLRSGECTLAIAGGVTVMPTPRGFVEFSRQRGLAPDGVCKAYADHADGTVWSEGSGLLLVERLGDARRRGHRVLAVVRGSATNQDGASNGLTAPHGPAQQRLIRQALANARLSPAQVDVVEGHGTGTALGDPIEATALVATYGKDRPADRPLWLGSVKSNIGHPQSAAGVAGLIKMVMAMQHGLLPGTLHVDRPSSQVDWSAGAVSLLTETTAWPRVGHPRRAAVSSFGIGGTNAHVIIEEAPAADIPDVDLGEAEELPAHDAVIPWPVSGLDSEALRAQADRLRAYVVGSDVRPADIGVALATTRTAFRHRAVVLGRESHDFERGLAALADGEPAAGLITGTVVDNPSIACLFTGQGAQYPGMGSDLFQAFPVFADTLETICGYLDLHLDRSLQEIILAPEGSPAAELLDLTQYTQPALFAFEVALWRLMEFGGLRPAFVAGHSVGELVAAYVAGVLSLEDACTLVTARGRLMGTVPEGGGMASIEASEQELQPDVMRAGGRVDIAAVNGPRSTVISGDKQVVLDLARQWRGAGRNVRRLRVSHAMHSGHLDPILEQYRHIVAGLSFVPPRIPIVSGRSGRLATAEELSTPDYWVGNLRDAVRFRDAVCTLSSHAVTGYVEVGPNAVLAPLVPDCVDSLSKSPIVVATQRRGRPQTRMIAQAFAQLHVHGVELDWTALFGGRPARRVDLPTYAFQRRRYWPGSSKGRPVRIASGGLRAIDHPWLEGMTSLADTGSYLMTGSISMSRHPWLGDHEVFGLTVFPGTGLLELAMQAGMRTGCRYVNELTLESPLLLPAKGGVHVQVVVGALDGNGLRGIGIYSRSDSASESTAWTRHANGVLADTAVGSEPRGDVEQWPPDTAVSVPVDDMYSGFADRGLEYGPAFRGLRAAWRRGDEVFAEICPLPRHDDGFGLHPALLDAALHAAALVTADENDGVLLPFSWQGVTLHSGSPSSLRVHMSTTGNRITLRVTDETGAAVATVERLVSVRTTMSQLVAALPQGKSSLLQVKWSPAPDRPAPETPQDWAVVGSGIDDLRGALRAAGVRVDEHSDMSTVDAARVVLSQWASPGNADVSPAAIHAATVRALRIVQSWLAENRFTGARMIVLTRGAVSVTAIDRTVDPVNASIWGLLSSVVAEYPGRFILVDSDDTAASFRVLPALTGGGESQAAIRHGVVYLPQLVPTENTDVLTPPDSVSAWSLQAGDTATLDDLRLAAHPDASKSLENGQIRVAVRAAGVNFRDVMITLGRYPGEACLGGEMAGVVVGVGPGVPEFLPGDRVFGLCANAFGPTVITDARTVALMPDGWSFAQGASVALVFLTAYYALTDLAGLRSGEKILIHAATGGVGMAAVQLARHLGAELFCTAGPAKWPTLRGLGLVDERIASSRDPEFGSRFQASSGGRGVDVVLNSLAGKFVDASLELLSGGGRFIEMGKTDIRDADQVSAEHPGVAYRAFDLAEAGPERIRQMLDELLPLFEQGVLTPLPLTTWDVRRAPEAFRFLSQARHVGKVVLTIPRARDSDGTVLVTGGTGTLGRLLVRHLVTRHDVRHLLLVSRRGIQAPGAGEMVSELAELGAHATVVQGDVANRDEIARVLASVPEAHPLTSIIHLAGIADDGIVTALTDERTDAVLSPKVDGAVHLHELTAGSDLAEFVLFSSAAVFFGSVGQANYAAANAFLDALAFNRAGQGLPAVSLAWGLWASESEVSGRLGTTGLRHILRAGIIPIPTSDAMAMFDAALTVGQSTVVPLRYDSDMLGQRPDMWFTPMLAPDGATRRAGATAQPSMPETVRIAARLDGLTADEQITLLSTLVREQLAVVLGHDTAEWVPADREFAALGVDSLAAVEVRNRLSALTDLRLPATVLFDYTTPEALAAHLSRQLAATDTA